jgi:cyanophycin synthetase
MNIVASQFFSGPNLYADSSVAVLTMDIREVPGLLNLGASYRLLPRSHPRPSSDGLFETWQAAARVARDVPQLLVSFAVALLRDYSIEDGSGRVLNASASRIHIVVPCYHPEIGVSACRLSGKATLRYLEICGTDDTLAADHQEFRTTAGRFTLSHHTAPLAREAARRGIPWYRVSGDHVQLGQGVHGRHILKTAIETTGLIGHLLTQSKAATSNILAGLGLPVMPLKEVFNQDQALQAAAAIGYPVVVKPCHGYKGRAVSVQLTAPEQVAAAFEWAAGKGDSVVVERHAEGNDYRLLVVGGRMIAAAQRIPAQVVGDGRRSVEQLVDELNQDPRRGDPHPNLMEKIRFDAQALELLEELGLGPSSVPAAEQIVRLRRIANISQGGTAADVTDAVHPDNRRAAETAATAAELNIAGIDFISPDVSRSWKEVGGAIIEVNSFPGLRPHWLGNPERDVVGPIIDEIFPSGAKTRIPTAAITGSIGKTTTSRMVALILARAGMRVGACTTEGIWVGEECIRRGDWAGGRAIHWLLTDRRVEAGVFEMARGGLLKFGMILDRCDVAAVLNVLNNHVGIDGVNSRSQLAAIKSTVVRRATNMVVLNGEDDLCLSMRRHVRAARICLVGTKGEQGELGAHVRSGGCAVLLEGSGQDTRIALYDRAAKLVEIPTRDIPATLNGLHKPKVCNALFATAIAFGLGIGTDAIVTGLTAFRSSFEQNPGRFNIIDQHAFRVIVDTADGAEAVGGLAQVARSLAVSGRRMLLLTAPGNRPDDYIIAMGRAAAGAFDSYVCCNRKDLRGRAPDEVPSLLGRGLMEAGVDAGAICRAEVEDRALADLLSTLRTGDLAVLSISTTRSAWAWEQITGFANSRAPGIAEASRSH